MLFSSCGPQFCNHYKYIVKYDYNIIIYKNYPCQAKIYTEVVFMADEIRIKKKVAKKGDDGYKIVSVRMKDELIARLDELSSQTNRSRNEIINLLLESAVEIVKIEG